MDDKLNLDDLRKQLDEVDEALVTLYEKRLNICTHVAEYKQQNRIPVLDAKRESEKLVAVRSMARNPEYTASIESLFIQIMADCSELQRRLIQDMDGEIK